METETRNLPDFDKFIATCKNLWDDCPILGYEIHEHLDPKGWWTYEQANFNGTLNERLHNFREALRRLNWVIADIKNDRHVRENV